MFNKLCPALTAKETTTVRAAAAEHERLWALATKYQRPHAMQGVLAPAHPLHLALDAALAKVAASPTEENIVAALDAAARKAALTEAIASSIGGSMYKRIDRLRESLRGIAARLVEHAREKFDIEADQRRAALPTGEAGGVIGGDPAAELESAIATAKAALETEIEEFTRDLLVSLPPLVES